MMEKIADDQINEVHYFFERLDDRQLEIWIENYYVNLGLAYRLRPKIVPKGWAPPKPMCDEFPGLYRYQKEGLEIALRERTKRVIRP